MAAGLNKVILMGNLTADPEFKTTPSGVSVTTFTVAVGRRFVKQGDEVTADFIRVTCWRQQAEFVSKYFGKGRMINVVGSLQTRTWDDQNGQKHYATEEIAEELNFCGEPKQDGSGARPAQNFQPQPNFGVPQSEPSGFQPIDIDDDLPF